MNEMKIIWFVIAVMSTIATHGQQINGGRIEHVELFHSGFVEPRNIDIWLPDTYSTEKKYAVLYMHDGQMLFDSTTTWNGQEWGVDETMSALLGQNKIRDCIVVGISNTKWRSLEYAMDDALMYFDSTALQFLHTDKEAMQFFMDSSFRGNKYLQFIVEELKPYIDAHYSTYSDQQNTFIAGSSRGGIISLYAICKYPEVFSGAACLSTHWTSLYREENNPFVDAHIKYFRAHIPDPAMHSIYFDYGTKGLDTLYANAQSRIDEVMQLKGYTKKNWITKKFPGADHSERDWNARLEIPITFLLKE